MRRSEQRSERTGQVVILLAFAVNMAGARSERNGARMAVSSQQQVIKHGTALRAARAQISTPRTTLTERRDPRSDDARLY